MISGTVSLYFFFSFCGVGILFYGVWGLLLLFWEGVQEDSSNSNFNCLLPSYENLSGVMTFPVYYHPAV